MHLLFSKPLRRHSRRLTLGLLLALTLLLAACGGDSAADATGTPVDDAAETAGNTSTDAAGETAGAAPAAASGVLRVAMQPIVNTDPLDDFVRRRGAGRQPRLRLPRRHRPRLQHGAPPGHRLDISDDGLTYTFHLAEGVPFHDGSPLTAADVVWTFDRLRTPPDTPTSDLYATSPRSRPPAIWKSPSPWPSPTLLPLRPERQPRPDRQGRHGEMPHATSTAPARSRSPATARKTAWSSRPTPTTSSTANPASPTWKSSSSATRRPAWMPCAAARSTWSCACRRRSSSPCRTSRASDCRHPHQWL